MDGATERTRAQKLGGLGTPPTRVIPFRTHSDSKRFFASPDLTALHAMKHTSDLPEIHRHNLERQRNEQGLDRPDHP